MPPFPSPRHRPGPPARGNALILALLGLVVSGLAALGLVHGQRLKVRQEAGAAEGGILDALRNASNALVFEQLPALQAGEDLEKDGTRVVAQEVEGVTTWRPTVDQLVAMRYLPAGWAARRSTLNHAPYTVTLRRVPAGCSGADCAIDGQVLLEGPLRDGDAGDTAASDGAVIGPILTKVGVDAGVSLATGPATITGWGRTWETPNPVAGQPAGVVAVRVGTLASAWSQFVRIGDTRDPNLAGNLTVAGDTVFGAAGTRHTSTVNGLLRVRGPAGTDCVTLDAAGRVAVHCDGRLDARTGTFTDDAGHTTRVDDLGVDTTGRVQSDDGWETASMRGFSQADPQSLVVKSGDLLVKAADGRSLMRVRADGEVSVTGSVVAGAQVRGQDLVLTRTLVEGSTCVAGQVSTLADGGLASCVGGAMRAVTRYGQFGGACTTAGVAAVDTGTGESLICRAGQYASVTKLMSSRVLVATVAVVDGSVVAPLSLAPGGCNATAAGGRFGIYLQPVSDANTQDNTVLNRIATWDANSLSWFVHLTDGMGSSTTSTALAHVYCDY